MDIDDNSHVESLERDLETTEWILGKVRSDNIYAQNLYAALCNNDFTPNKVWDILTDRRCSFSWRHSGQVIADMVGEGDYGDWYCTGVFAYTWDNVTMALNLAVYITVPEGYVTCEVREDLLKLGWIVVKSPD